jgi:hypothetical protein
MVKKRKSRKKSVFAKKGDPFTRTGRRTKKKVKSGIDFATSKVSGAIRIKRQVFSVKAKKGVKKGIKRRKR